MAEAKISRATSYTYFEDQGYLLSALSEHVVSDMVDAGRHWWSIPPEATKADLRKAVQPPCDSYRRYRAPWGAVVESAAYDVRMRAVRADRPEGHQGTCHAHPRRTASGSTWITWMGGRGMHQLVSPGSDEQADRQAGALTDVLWKLLYDGCR